LLHLAVTSAKNFIRLAAIVAVPRFGIGSFQFRLYEDSFLLALLFVPVAAERVRRLPR
jgi:hypothetical protein